MGVRGDNQIVFLKLPPNINSYDENVEILVETVYF